LRDCIVDSFEALRWVYTNISRFGGDPNRIYVGGHSAGGHLAALLVLDRDGQRSRGIQQGAVRSCLPMSAVFSLIKSEIPATSFMHRFYGEMFETESDAVSATAYTHLNGNSTPFYLTWGERDAFELLPDNERMARVAKSQGFLTGTHIFPGADHFAAHLACLDPNGPWINAVRAFIGR
jgi:acetyl esterase/lipase